ncbi:MAG: TIGR03943 family protein [Corynebacteriales bacterium]|nr:TIGR03943 family protein [Mycobacteriales bacterium]
MSKTVQSMVMIVVAALVLQMSFTDVHLRYVKADLQPYLVASGILLLLVGVVTLGYEMWQSLFVAEAKPSASDAACCGHSENGSGPRSAWLLVLPIAALVLIAPPTLGSYAASKSGTATSVAKQQNPRSIYPALPEGDVVPLSMLDYAARATFERGASLAGREVKLVGFISPREGGGVYLTRMMMMCCAADSRPIKVGMSGDVGKLKSDQWVEVRGQYVNKFDTDPANGEEIPYIKVSSLKRVEQPENPYDI